MFYDERYSEVYLSTDCPDYVKWAEAMGCVGIRVESPEEVEPAIEKANSINDRTVVVEFRTDADEKVFPMVPAGRSNDDLDRPPDTASHPQPACSERGTTMTAKQPVRLVRQPPHSFSARAEPPWRARACGHPVRPTRPTTSSRWRWRLPRRTA
jgi:hypothetical protein